MRTEVLIGQIMSHLIVSDKQIHSNEMDILEGYWQNHEFNEEEKGLCLAILGDRDEKFLLDELLAEIGKIGLINAEKLQLITTLCELTVCDMNIDDSETEIMEKVAGQIHFMDQESILQKVYNKAKEEKEADESRERSMISTIGLWIRSLFSFGKAKREINFILKEPKYVEAIRSSAEIAKNDMVFITDIIDDNSKVAEECLESAKISLKNNVQNRDLKEAQELEENIYNFIKVLEEKVIHAVRENKEILNRKRRAMNYFTISFLGRTGAGKSTLHAFMIGGGNDFIGSGGQRATRFNRVFEWENIRIIDTPGIGAAEEEGRTDEEIARTVVDETDFLCYIVTDDSVQKSEFNFMENIRAKNKPIIILLNVKDDITRSDAIFRKFMQNPHYWAKREDEKNIQGHINRIKDYISKLENFNTDFVEIIPVHLLAALLSTEENDRDYKKKLYEGSHFDDFKYFIRESIINSIKLRRSQTVIDDTAGYINENLKDIENVHTKYLAFAEKVKENKSAMLKKIKEDEKKVVGNCLQDIETLFEKFREQINEFVEKNYALNKNALEKAWVSYEETTMKIDSRIDEVIREQLKQEQKDIQDYIKDFISDMSSFFEHQGIELNIPNRFNAKGAFSLIGEALIAIGTAITLLAGFFPIIEVVLGAATGPISLGLMAIGAAFLYISTHLKDNENKQEIIGELKDRLQKNVEEHKTKAKKAIPEIITKNMNEMSAKIEKMLSQIQSGAEAIEKSSLVLLNKYIKSFDETNRYFARRICDYCSGNVRPRLEPGEYSGIRVERDYGKEFRIWTATDCPEKSVETAKKFLQENIYILQPDKDEN